MGEQLVTADTVVKGGSEAAQVHAELAASSPADASWPDHARGGSGPRPGTPHPPSPPSHPSSSPPAGSDLLSSVTTPFHEHLHLIGQLLPVTIVRAETEALV